MFDRMNSERECVCILTNVCAMIALNLWTNRRLEAKFSRIR
ncbi:hypothetical protein LEP1GSC120_1538 [Leptospira santarosai str. 200702252]|nr:hypothetical protein LEP1GSC120_1538 [Leptospira santarosai str. 200702252]